MPTIEFDFSGQTFEVDVADTFLKRPGEEQRRLLKQNLIDKYETRKPPRGTEEKGVLDYLALLERPAQALKVGLKESEVGGNVFRALGGVDLTPEEGLLTGLERGWMGEDEVRTQDFLPENLDPATKMILGFAGDVATDPLTWYAPAAVGLAGRTIKAHTPRSVANALQKSKDWAMDLKFGESDVGLPDLARYFNVPVGMGRVVKGEAGESLKLLREREKVLADELPQLNEFFKRRSAQVGMSVPKLERIFRDTIERQREGGELVGLGDEAIDSLGDEGVALLKTWESRIKDWSDESAAFGMPFDEVTHRGYFPRVLTPQGRKLLEEGKVPFIQGVDEFGQPMYKAGYRGPREFMPEDSVTDVNRAMAQAMGDPTPNPAELAYKFQFFHESPFLALGTRWSRQNLALQRKWFIDEITDGSRAVGPMVNNSMIRNAEQSLIDTGLYKRWDPMARGWVDSSPPWSDVQDKALEMAKKEGRIKQEKGIGKWVRRVPGTEGRGEQLQVRYLNPNYRGWGRLDKEGHGQYKWETIDDSDEFYKLYRKVEGIRETGISDDLLDDEWSRVFQEQVKMRVPTPAWNRIKEFGNKRLNDEDMRGLPEGYKEAKNVADAARRIMKEDNTGVFVAPKQVARQVEDHISLMAGDVRGEKQLKNFLKFYDGIQNSWKAWTLGVRPAYHTRNVVGNMLNAYNVSGLGEKPIEAVRLFTAAGKLQYYARFGGSNAKKDEVIGNMQGLRMKLEKKAPTVDDELWRSPNYEGTGYSMQQIVEGATDRGISAGHYTADSIRDVERAMEAQAGVGSRLSRTLGPENPAVRAGFLVGGTLEGNARYAVFMNALANIRKNPGKYDWTAPDGSKVSLSDWKGHFKTITETDDIGVLRQRRVPVTRDDMIMDIAGQDVKASLFDYADVSRFERDILKRTMPFYTWTRKNIPAQLRALVKNPQRAEKLHLAIEQFEHDAGDLDISDYGKFWGERMPVFLGKETNGVIKAFTMLNVVPFVDLQRLVNRKALVAEMTSPLIKVPLENLLNYDSFRKTPISAYENESKDFLGVKLPSRLWHLAQVIVPLSEINRLNPLGVFGERIKDPETGITTSTAAFGGLGAQREAAMDAHEVARWIRFFTGGVTYDVDLAKHRYIENRNMMKDLAELKGKMKWAFANSQNRRAEQILQVIEAVEMQKITDPLDKR